MTDERNEKWREAVELFGRPVIHDHYGTGVINGVWFHGHQGILFNVRFDDSGIDDEWLGQVKLVCAFCRHPKESHNDGKFQQMPCSFTDVDSHDESEVRCMCYGWCDTREEAEALAIGIESGSPLGGAKAKVILFRQSGKYYCEEEWRIPYGAIGPYDMERSLDFRRIDGGPVLVHTQEPWGYPHLFPGVKK